MVVALMLAGAALAQLPAAKLQAVFPPGATPGQTVEVTISGDDLDDADRLLFSHEGINATQKTREPGLFETGPQIVPNTFVVAVAGNVPPGRHDVRAAGKYGASNPRAFIVGDLTESVETEPNNQPEEAAAVQMPAVINGRSDSSGDVDWFKLSATAGQRILLHCRAHDIDSAMDPVVVVFAPDGRELTSNRDGGGRDPLVDFTAAAAGDYAVKVYDSTYRGGGEHFYRLRAGELPHIDYVFPPAAQPGNQRLTLYGRNLPGGKPAGETPEGRPLESAEVTVNIPSGGPPSAPRSAVVLAGGAGLDLIEYQVKGPAGLSNAVLIGIAAAPPIVEAEPNDSAAAAQKIAAPCEFMGRFFPDRDQDWVTFDAGQGDVLAIDLISQRMGADTDAGLIVFQVTTDGEGKEQLQQIAAAEDVGTREADAVFDDRSYDPALLFTAPADGTYRLLIRNDFSSTSDPRRVYRLRIRSPQPDFRLAAAPDAAGGLMLRKGGSAGIKVVAFRQDGFDGDIELSVSGLPAGVTCPGATLGGGKNAATLVLTAAENAAPAVTAIQISGKAKIGGADAARTARTGESIQPLPGRQNNNQQRTSGELRLTSGLLVSVSAGELEPFSLTAGEGKVYETSRAGILKIPVAVARRNGFGGNVSVMADDLPPQVQTNQANVGGNGTGEIQLTLLENAPTGTYAMYVSGFTQVPYSRNPEAVEAAKKRQEDLAKAVTETGEALKKANDAKTAADQSLTKAQTELKAATDAKAAADKVLADAEAAAKSAADKAAQSKAAAAENPGDQNLANQAAADAKTAAESEAVVKTAAAAVAAAQKQLDESAAAEKKAAQTQGVAMQVAAEAAALAKSATDAKAAADQRVNQAAAAANPQNRNVWVPSTSFTVKITPAPITMAPIAAQTVKQGEMIEAPVTIQRLYGFDGQVNLQTIVQGVGGLNIPNSSVPQGQTAGKIPITAAANATPGKHALTLRITMNLNGRNVTIEEPLELTVVEVKKEGE